MLKSLPHQFYQSSSPFLDQKCRCSGSGMVSEYNIYVKKEHESTTISTQTTSEQSQGAINSLQDKILKIIFGFVDSTECWHKVVCKKKIKI